jgi:cephalosporin hydroxylase
MKEFNENNITQRTDLVTSNSISCYMGHGAQQNPNAFRAFFNFLQLVKPARILEIGTGMGGFTMFLRLVSNDLGLNLGIRTYDVNGREGYDSLQKENVDVRVENIFVNGYKEAPQEVIDYIQTDGITIVLCDGGNKIAEFNLLSKFIKTGDYIFAHDYARNNGYFQEHINGQIWNWMEISDSDISNAIIHNNLSPFMETEFQEAVWVCKIKN